MNTLDINQVLEVVQNYRTPDKRVTKSMIASVLHLPYSNSQNDPVDRSIRDAITELRKQGEPICMVKGKAGYCYGWEYIDDTIADYRSRGDKVFSTARILERGQQEYRENKLREQVRQNQPVREAVQGALWG
jgi:hypothetical protein